MSVRVNAVREREPWGPGAWFAEIVDATTGAVVATSDYARGRSAAEREAEKIAASRGWEVQ